MNLRELMMERIMFAYTEEDLATIFRTTEEELEELSDLDFLEIYDEAVQG